MYTVMIVDDEKSIRENLPQVIDFAGSGFRVIATARNGADAWEQIQARRPDLLLTDIRMPILDGLGLIKQLHEAGYEDLPVILLSGYSDFSYAKQAMKFGVKAFLTKPVDEHEAEAMLDEIRIELDIQKRAEKQREIDRRKQQLEEAEASGLPLRGMSGDALMYCVLQSLYSDAEEVSAYQVLQDGMRALVPGYDLLYSVDGFFYTYYLPESLLGDRFEHGDPFLRQAEAEAMDRGLSCVFVLDRAILAEGTRVADQLIRHKERVLTHLFYTHSRGLAYRYIPSYTEASAFEGQEIYIESLRQQIQNGESKAALVTFDTMSMVLRQRKLCWRLVNDLNYLLYYMLSDILQGTKNSGDENPVHHPSKWLSSPYFSHFRKWQELYSEMILEVCMLVSKDQKQDSLGVIGEILEYLRKHYRTPVAIKEVAEHFHMNAAYLGRMFQKSTGVSFNHYVNSLRLTEARRLLRSTDNKIYEIAEQVGFSSSKYFIVKFVQEEGISPLEYRKLVLEEDPA